ncbi:hypothetical protein BY458DRAFT_551499, partial [Sporodiniella umbellata]
MTQYRFIILFDFYPVSFSCNKGCISLPLLGKRGGICVFPGFEHHHDTTVIQDNMQLCNSASMVVFYLPGLGRIQLSQKAESLILSFVSHTKLFLYQLTPKGGVAVNSAAQLSGSFPINVCYIGFEYYGFYILGLLLAHPEIPLAIAQVKYLVIYHKDRLKAQCHSYLKNVKGVARDYGYTYCINTK